jgi:hypothetical protein
LIRPLFLEAGVALTEMVELYALAALDGKSVKLGWHKDRPAGGGIHSFQLPLLDGDCFHELVPASHLRELTDSEIRARNAGGEGMPGAIQIALNRGDVLLRNPSILHRGFNPRGDERLTIVGTYT